MLSTRPPEEEEDDGTKRWRKFFKGARHYPAQNDDSFIHLNAYAVIDKMASDRSTRETAKTDGRVIFLQRRRPLPISRSALRWQFPSRTTITWKWSPAVKSFGLFRRFLDGFKVIAATGHVSPSSLWLAHREREKGEGTRTEFQITLGGRESRGGSEEEEEKYAPSKRAGPLFFFKRAASCVRKKKKKRSAFG